MGAMMMLQDWTSLSGATSSDTVIQDSVDWVNCSNYSDVIFYLQVKEANVTITLEYQTSAVEDEPFWIAMKTLTIAAGSTTVQTPIKYATASTPLASLVRFKLAGATNNWMTTFRIAMMLKSA